MRAPNAAACSHRGRFSAIQRVACAKTPTPTVPAQWQFQRHRFRADPAEPRDQEPRLRRRDLESRNHRMIMAITAKRGGQFGAVASDRLLAALR
jgi:hypothetical protein